MAPFKRLYSQSLAIAASNSAILAMPEAEHQAVLRRGYPQHKYGPVDGKTLATYVHRVQSVFGLVCGLCNLQIFKRKYTDVTRICYNHMVKGTIRRLRICVISVYFHTQPVDQTKQTLDKRLCFDREMVDSRSKAFCTVLCTPASQSKQAEGLFCI